MFTVDGRVFGRDSTEPRMPTCFHSRSGATLRGMAIDAVEVHQYYEQGAYLGSGQVPVLDTSIPPWFGLPVANLQYGCFVHIRPASLYTPHFPSP